jgi:putative FmdB family regulatory protein
MPIYEYRCRACGHTSELLRPVDRADAPVDCDCGETDTVRLPSLIARGQGAGAELPMAGGAPAGGAPAGGGCCGGGCCA